MSQASQESMKQFQHKNNQEDANMMNRNTKRKCRTNSTKTEEQKPKGPDREINLTRITKF